MINAVEATRFNLSFHDDDFDVWHRFGSLRCYVILVVVDILFHFCCRTACAIELNWMSVCAVR